MSDRRRYGSLLCPDCGHHLHRPNPGICQWYDCGCPAEAAAPAGLDVEALALVFAGITFSEWADAQGDTTRLFDLTRHVAAEYDHLRQGKRE